MDFYVGKKVLVTGGAGFIGSHIVDALLHYGVGTVRILDNFSTGSLTNLTKAFESNRVELVEGDIRDAETCQQCSTDIDVVFHTAAEISVTKSMLSPETTNATNISGTLNMLNAAAKCGVKRFVYASSAAVYGIPTSLPCDESSERNYTSPYGLSKGINEDMATLWASNNELGNGMTCIGLRYFNVYGPRQDPKSPYSGVISIFMDRIRTRQPIQFFGDGLQTRDFVYVADVVQANVLAGAYVFPQDTTSHIYNVGSGVSVSLYELKQTIEERVGISVCEEYLPVRPGDIRDSVANIQRISEELGYRPRYTLEKGLSALNCLNEFIQE